jgi:L-rhamnose mutarotase
MKAGIFWQTTCLLPITLFMTRHAFTMKLKRGTIAEYKKRHDAIWPELAEALRAAGISNYSIFLDEQTLTLFAVQDQADPDAAAALPKNPVVKKWWAYMAPLMEANPDNSPVCGALREVFHLA